MGRGGALEGHRLRSASGGGIRGARPERGGRRPGLRRLGLRLARGDRAHGRLYYIKGGWQHGFFTFGDSAFSLDYGRNVNAPARDSDGHTVGAVALQHIEGYGTELFAGFRVYDLDQADDVDLDRIYVTTVGTRVKF
jgi:hypothetical protein